IPRALKTLHHAPVSPATHEKKNQACVRGAVNTLGASASTIALCSEKQDIDAPSKLRRQNIVIWLYRVKP
ncbi:hypothetical protein, partial [Pseudomonas sp.]|uniref:hypothetical protein n=1 Tax=Pseudomonas sp. TaxID=306 RepID=UPI00258AA3F1